MVGDGVCEGSVVLFTTAGSKYCIEYTDGTTAALTKIALNKVLSPPPIAGTAAATDAASAVIGRTAVGGGIPTATEATTKAPPEGETAASALAALDEAAATDGTVSKAGVQHQRKRTNRSHIMHEDPSAASSQFSDGQLVWAKCGKHPHWPARISGVNRL